MLSLTDELNHSVIVNIYEQAFLSRILRKKVKF